jgi:hypothetical protein
MIGNLRVMLGRNSSTRLLPASAIMEDAKMSPTTLAVTLSSLCEREGSDAKSGLVVAASSGAVLYL